MCGILGQVRINKEIDRDQAGFRRALDPMSHRGPDDAGVVCGKNFIFGHRRLSIQDLSKMARQPMTSSDGMVTLTFNGEIYNFKELRHLLEGKGYRFASQGDTEVLLNGFHCYGIDFVKKCNGMFACAVHDQRSNTTYLVRDRLGLKPLYYTSVKGQLLFASEIKSILAYGSLPRQLNLSAVVSYFAYRYPILDDTFFEGIFSLPPAHFLKVYNGTIALRKYWDPTDNFLERCVDKGEQFYVEELQRLLRSALRYRLIADVPIGACLSGGVDSSILTAMMAEETPRQIKSFSIGYDEDEFNEFHFAQLIAKKYRTQHHELLQTADGYLDDLEKLICFKDAPLSIPNEVPLHQMAVEMKKQVTVALSGNGSDEIFCGYGKIFRSVDDYQRLKTFSAMPSCREKLTFLDNFLNKYKTTSFASELDHFLSLYNYTPGLSRNELLSPSIDLSEMEEQQKDRFKTLAGQVQSGNYLDKMVYTFVKIHLPGILLYQDMAFMASSMEIRVPFIDHRIVEFAFRIPHHYLLRWRSEEEKKQSRLLMSSTISEKYDIPKYILKKAFKSMIPEEIMVRRKKGFPVPLRKWFGDGGCPLVRDSLLSSRAQSRGLYNKKSVTKWLNHTKANSDSGSARRLWMLYNLELFMRKYFDGQALSPEN